MIEKKPKQLRELDLFMHYTNDGVADSTEPTEPVYSPVPVSESNENLVPTQKTKIRRFIGVGSFVGFLILGASVGWGGITSLVVDLFGMAVISHHMDKI